MNQNELSILLRRELLAGFARYGYPDIPVEQAYQPTSQGRKDSFVHYFVISDTPEGAQFTKRVPGFMGEDLVTQETQIMVTSYQVGAIVPVDINDVTQKTAKDLTVLANMIIKSQPFIRAMRAAGVGVRAPSPIRTPTFINDRDEYEFNPSFDCTFTHKQVIIQNTDFTEKVEINIRRV